MQRILKILFIAWIIIWANFIIRDLFKGRLLNDYRILLSRSEEGKRSYVYGDQLYKSLNYWKNTLRDNDTYDLSGITADSIEGRRTVYYLYPAVKIKNGRNLFVFDGAKFMMRQIR